MSYPQATVPSAVSQASVEDLVWGFDCTALGTPASPTVTLTGPTGATVTLQDAPQVVGNVIYQRVRGAVLSASPRPYQLTATFTETATTNVFAAVLLIQCPF